MRFFGIPDLQKLPWEMSALAVYLAAAPYYLAVSAPRTVPFDGYRGLAIATPVLFLLVALALVIARTVRTKLEIPTWLLAAMPLSLVWNRAPLWIATCSLAGGAAVVGSLRHRLTRFQRPQATFSSAFMLVSTVAATQWLYDSRLSTLDIRPALATILPFLAPHLFVRQNTDAIAYLSDGTTTSLHVSLDKLGGVFPVVLATVLLCLSILRHRRTREIALDLLVLTVYSVVAGLFILTGISGAPEVGWFDETQWLVAYLPLVMYFAIRLHSSPKVSQPVGRSAQSHRIEWLLAPGALLMVASTVMWGPVSEKKGSVVIDEAHGEWESTQVPLTQTLFGSFSVYNYHEFSRQLADRFGATIADHELSADELANCSVLILKTPTEPYSDRFCTAVEKFVSNGGGLWLVGDHTNAFGMSDYLNKIAERFGLRFEKNAWIEHPYKRNLWAPNPFTDPVAASLPDFLFYTGCQLACGPLDTRLMMGNRMVFEDADYSAGSYFGPLRFVPSNNSGSAVMAVLASRGRGRIAVWSDSTLFSTFSIDTPGKSAIAFNTIEWLSRKNEIPNFRLILLVVGGTFFALGLLARRPLTAWCSLILAITWSPGMQMLNRGTTKVWSEQSVRSGDPVAFYEPDKTDHLPIYMSIDTPGPTFYWSSFVAAQRSNRRPYYTLDWDDAKTAKTIVVIPAPWLFSQSDAKNLAQWVERGGRLIILDGLKDYGVFANQLFKLLDRASPFDTSVAGLRNLVDSKHQPVGKVRCKSLLGAQTPEIFDETGRPAQGVYYVGKGQIAISGTDQLFSDASVGEVQSVPTKPQIGVLRVLFGLYESTRG